MASARRQEEDENSNIEEGRLYFKFSESRVPQIVRQVLEENGWLEWDPELHPEWLWSLHWKSGRFKLTDWDRCLSNQRINHCPKTSAITKKDNLHRNLKRLCGSYGSVYNFSPTTYVLPNEYVNFMREYAEQTEPEIWICKPSDSSRGRGIFLIRDMTELIYDQQYVIQKYINDPLLLGGFKFDLRLYVLVPSFHPMKAYLYDEGLVRFATDKYSNDANTDLTNVYAHLTNSSINKYSPSLNENKATIGSGCKWPLSRLLKYMQDSNMDAAHIMQRIKNIIVLTLLALWPKVPGQKSGFELLGFDVMLDSDLNPWLIEVNASPALSTDTPLDVQVKGRLLHDTLQVLAIKPHEKVAAPARKPLFTSGVSRRVTAHPPMERQRSLPSKLPSSTSSTANTTLLPSTRRNSNGTDAHAATHATPSRTSTKRPVGSTARLSHSHSISSISGTSSASTVAGSGAGGSSGELRKVAGTGAGAGSEGAGGGTGGSSVGASGRSAASTLNATQKPPSAPSSASSRAKPPLPAINHAHSSSQQHQAPPEPAPKPPSTPGPEKIGSYERIFPATLEMEKLANEASHNGTIDIRPLVCAIREDEMQIMMQVITRGSHVKVLIISNGSFEKFRGKLGRKG